MTILDRRTLLTGIGALICAPAIVRASSLMPVKMWQEPSAQTALQISAMERQARAAIDKMLAALKRVNSGVAGSFWRIDRDGITPIDPAQVYLAT